jgi:hypothetical protein
MSHFSEIENYIRDIISKNHGIFNRDTIMMQSAEWMQKFPVEFNSILNFIENEETNDMMDDTPSSVAFGSRIADDSTSSVAFGSRIADDSTSSVAFGSRIADDTPSSVAFGSRIADDSTSSVIFGARIADDSTSSVAIGSKIDDDSTSSVIFGARIADDLASSVVNMHDQMSQVSDSPMGSEHIDSSPGGYPDDDFDSYMPLQRSMSSTTPP